MTVEYHGARHHSCAVCASQQAQFAAPARAGSTTNALLTLASQTLLPSEPSEALQELPQDGALAAHGTFLCGRF